MNKKPYLLGGLGLVLLTGALIPKTALANVTFSDLIASKFNGKDSDLSGFALTGVGLNCMDTNVYSGGPPILSWNLKGIQNHPDGKHFLVKSFRVHFRVKDRKATVVHEEAFTYKDDDSGGFEKKQLVNHQHDRCNRDYVALSKQIDLSYKTVEYWISNIEWAPYAPQQPQTDRVAFTVKDAISDYHAGEKTKQAVADQLVVRFKRPTGTLGEVTPGWLCVTKRVLRSVCQNRRQLE